MKKLLYSKALESIQNDLSVAAGFLNSFSDEMKKAKKIVQKYKAYDQFKRESNPYGEYFDTKEIFRAMSDYSWSEAISKVSFLSFEQKKKLIEGQQKSKVCFNQESSNYFKDLEQNKHSYIQESLNTFHRQLTNYRCYKGRKRIEKKSAKIEKTIRFFKFSDFDSGYYDNYHGEQAQWFGDLENLLRFISGREPDNSKDNFGERLKDESFRCYITGNYFDLRVLKSGNVEISFKEMFHCI